MTNSAPKISNKVERHGSPNNNGKRQNRAALIKTTTYFSSVRHNNQINSPVVNNSSYNNNNNVIRSTNSRASCSPPCNSKASRNSPSKSMEHSPRGSPTSSFYAGAKFSEPPSPATLPKPPSHWTTRILSSCKQSETCCNISNHLKMILNVQA